MKRSLTSTHYLASLLCHTQHTPLRFQYTLTSSSLKCSKDPIRGYCRIWNKRRNPTLMIQKTYQGPVTLAYCCLLPLISLVWPVSSPADSATWPGMPVFSAKRRTLIFLKLNETIPVITEAYQCHQETNKIVYQHYDMNKDIQASYRSCGDVIKSMFGFPVSRPASHVVTALLV